VSPALLGLSVNGPVKLAAVAVTFLGAGLAFAGWVSFAPHVAPLPDMVAVSLESAGGSQIFAQVRETTIVEWNRCYEDGACHLELHPPEGADPQSFPATGINWMDAQDYVHWLSKETRHPFRLPTSNEWFEMAKDVLPEVPDPIFTDPSLTWASAYQIEENIDRSLRPVGFWSTTAEGVADLDGNVWEWTGDCYNGETETSPEAPCAAYVLGGEHRAVISFLVRDPARGGCAVGAPPAHLGLRLVSDRHPIKS
jgi:formylglycine-generating enzyme required for sulfatase activity